MVNFNNNNLGLLSYLWDFGNGNISTLEIPGPQIYNDTGMYIVSYHAYSDTNSSYPSAVKSHTLFRQFDVSHCLAPMQTSSLNAATQSSD